MRSRLLWLLILGAFLAGCQWERSTEFREQLRCGMSPEEVDAIARAFGVPTFRQADDPNQFVTHVLNEGGTFVEFYFDQMGLETTRIGHHQGLTGTEYEPRVDLCSGLRTGSVTVTLVGPPELAGARIFVDGAERLRFPSRLPIQRTVGVPSGRHEIRIVKSGHEDLVFPVDYVVERTEDRLVIGLPGSRGEP